MRDDDTAVPRAYVRARHRGLGQLAAEGRRIVNRVSRWWAMSGNLAVLFAQ